MSAIINPIPFGGGGGGGLTLSDVQSAIDAALTPYDGDHNHKIDAPAQESYHHVQVVAATTWSIMHNLGVYPSSLLVLDSSGNPLEVSSKNISLNQLDIYFATPTMGEAFCSP